MSDCGGGCQTEVVVWETSGMGGVYVSRVGRRGKGGAYLISMPCMVANEVVGPMVERQHMNQ